MSTIDLSSSIGRLEAWLERVFAGSEVERDLRLRTICGALLLYFHMTFAEWWQATASLSTSAVAQLNYAPVALLHRLEPLVFLDRFQTATYLYVLAMMSLLGLFLLFRRGTGSLVLGLMAWLWLSKLYFYVCDYRLFASYHHFHLLFVLTFLITTDKLRFLRGALALGYFLSALVKLSPSWLFGEYFNSLPGKLPLLPKVDWVVTGASLSVFVLEALGPLCWFTRVRWLRRLSLAAFLLFHLYSGVIVGVRYTTLTLPLVVAAFLDFEEPLQAGYRFTRRHLAVFVIWGVVTAGALLHFFIPGDARLTREGRFYGWFMFDATRATHFETEIHKGNKIWSIRLDSVLGVYADSSGEATPIVCDFYEDGRWIRRFRVRRPIHDGGQVIFNPRYFTSANVRILGDPYLFYFYARSLQQRYRPDRIAIRLDQSINGHPEKVRLLDIPDFAALDPTYHLFTHNEWIRLPGPESPPEYRWP